MTTVIRRRRRDDDEGARNLSIALHRIDSTAGEWEQRACEAAAYVARKFGRLNRNFTSDDIWERLEDMDVPEPPNRRRMSYATRWLVREGLAVYLEDERHVPTRRPQANKRPIPQYRATEEK